MFTPSLTNPLRGLICAREGRSKRVSSWDETGGNRDWWGFEPGQTRTIADISGPGCINHIWMTSSSDEPAWPRRVLIRMFWDGQDTPSVEVPLGDFFGVGHGMLAEFECMAMNMTHHPSGGMRSAFNCCWPMPFAERCAHRGRQRGEMARPLYFYVDYEEHDQPPSDALYFHASWRRENPCDGWGGPRAMQAERKLNQKPNLDGAANYVVLDAERRGHYVGCNLDIDAGTAAGGARAMT